jgi:hypothetical protein
MRLKDSFKIKTANITPKGILRLFITANNPALTLVTPTFQRKNPSPVAIPPRYISDSH